MSLGVGARLGHYAVTAKLGEGGMGFRLTVDRPLKKARAIARELRRLEQVGRSAAQPKK